MFLQKKPQHNFIKTRKYSSVAPIFGQNHANARLYLDISPKIGAQKHPGRGLEPPLPPNGQCPNELWSFPYHRSGRVRTKLRSKIVQISWVFSDVHYRHCQTSQSLAKVSIWRKQRAKRTVLSLEGSEFVRQDMLCKQGNCNIFRYLSKKGLVGPRGRGVKDITKIGRKILLESQWLAEKVREVEDWGPGLFNTH